MTVLSEQDRKRLMQWVLDRGDARGLGDLVEAIVARHVAEAQCRHVELPDTLWPRLRVAEQDVANLSQDKATLSALATTLRLRAENAEAALAEAEQKGARGVVAGVRAWCAINEIAEPPLDWEGLGEFLTRTTTPPEPHGGTQ